MRKRIRYERVMENGHHFMKWNDLTEAEQADNMSMTQVVIDFCYENPNRLVTFDQMNKMGLSHVYHFLIDIFNEKHEKKIDVTDKGMVYNYCVNRIK